MHKEEEKNEEKTKIYHKEKESNKTTKILTMESLILLPILIIILIETGIIIYTQKEDQRLQSYSDKCWTYINNNLFSQAIEYANSINNNNKNSSMYFCIGTAYYHTGNFQLALQYLKKSAEMEKNTCLINDCNSIKLKEIYTYIAKTLYNMKKLDEAIEYYKKALDITSNENDRRNILTEIAKIYEEKGDTDNAIKYYEDSLTYYCYECRKEKIEIYKKIAELYKEKNNKTKAEEYSNKAFKLKQESR